MVATVIALHRRQFTHRVLVQIGLGNDAFTGHAGVDNSPSHAALVKTVCTQLADQAQGLGQVFLHQLLTGLERLALVQEDRT